MRDVIMLTLICTALLLAGLAAATAVGWLLALAIAPLFESVPFDEVWMACTAVVIVFGGPLTFEIRR